MANVVEGDYMAPRIRSNWKIARMRKICIYKYKYQVLHIVSKEISFKCYINMIIIKNNINKQINSLLYLFILLFYLFMKRHTIS